jgi:hypothetical protein
VPLTVEGSEVADQKLILYAPRQPLGALLDEVADLLGARWVLVQRPSGNKEYRLTRARKAFEYVEWYRREQDRRAKALWRGRLKRYQAMMRLAV